jgi:hypothetical protein
MDYACGVREACHHYHLPKQMTPQNSASHALLLVAMTTKRLASFQGQSFPCSSWELRYLATNINTCWHASRMLPFLCLLIANVIVFDCCYCSFHDYSGHCCHSCCCCPHCDQLPSSRHCPETPSSSSYHIPPHLLPPFPLFPSVYPPLFSSLLLGKHRLNCLF